MNIDRMKRQLERTGEAADQAAWQRKLAAMTPEHRAKHERPFYSLGMCGECLSVSMAASNAKVRAELVKMSQAMDEQTVAFQIGWDKGFGLTLDGQRMPPSVLIVGGP